LLVDLRDSVKPPRLIRRPANFAQCTLTCYIGLPASDVEPSPTSAPDAMGGTLMEVRPET